MMATQGLPNEEVDGINSTNMNTPPSKKSKSSKRTIRSTNSNDVVENGNGLLSESIKSKQSKRREKISTNDSKSETTTNMPLTNINSNTANHPSEFNSTSLQSSLSNSISMDNTAKFQQIELTTVSDDDDADNNNIDVRQKQSIRSKDNRVTTDHDPFVSSVTTMSENDVIEIHEFSSADIDAYLDIYFEVLHNRLLHFIGENDQIQRFRIAMKSRINSDQNAREYRNVLLGKLNGEVVAAVTLSFPEESTTIANENILPEVHSCLSPIRRWMVRNANYIPRNINECYIEMIGVKTAYRNQGIGIALLECVQHFAEQAGALLLTIHINEGQLRNYFSRFGFVIDQSDNSALWKWIVERQSINKMTKAITPNNDDGIDNMGSYINESIVESEDE